MNCFIPKKSHFLGKKLPGLVIGVIFLGIFFLFSPILQAKWETVTGHIKGQAHVLNWPDQTLGSPNSMTELGAADVRLKTAYSESHWRLSLDYQLQGQGGSQTAYQQQLSPYQNPDKTQLFNLTQKLVNQNDLLIWQRLDRLSLSYTKADYSVRFGRQALSWGNGNLFNPMDLFNPFAPNAIDTEYKSGSDMLNVQWLLASGDEVTAIAVPRRDAQTQTLDSKQSSAAMKGYHFGETLEWQWMVAQDYQDWVGAISLSGAWLQGAWNLDVVPTYLASKKLKTSVVANFSQAWTLFGHNASGYVEYYFNGFGASQSQPTLAELEADLQLKLNRNQIFVVNQHYADAGLTWEWTPLISLTPSWMHNLQDQSGLMLLSLSYSASNNSQLLAGLQLPYGAKGTEFGGLYVDASQQTIASPPSRVYAQFNYYF